MCKLDKKHPSYMWKIKISTKGHKGAIITHGIINITEKVLN